MSGKPVVAIVIFLTISIISQPASASHKLAFAVSVGDRCDYRLSYDGQFGRFDDAEIYLQIDRLPEIPDTVESLLDFLITHEAEYFHVNGTEVKPRGFMMDFCLVRVYETGYGGSGRLAYVPRCIPLGNLSFVGELLADFHDHYYTTTVLASERYWGFELEGNIYRNITWPFSDFNVSVDIHADYSIEDGFLSRYDVNVVNITSGLNYLYISMNRIDLVPEEMSIVAQYDPIPLTGTSETSLNDSQTLNLLIGTLNILSISVWSIVIVVLGRDYRKRRSDSF
ncbi:MAG: hypothetical protein ACXAEF_01955 [Candidatus Thorarchaeota archaeon]